MKLGKVLETVEVLRFDGQQEAEVTAITYDSRKVEPGGLFVCIKGMTTDGHLYADEAVSAGAVGVVTERWLDGLGAGQVLVGDTRSALARLAAGFYGWPARKLKLVGVTGTNGKTTTTYLVNSICAAAGFSTGLIGTLEYRIGAQRLPMERTTPESSDLQALLACMVEQEVKIAVMEVSSHAIDLHRVDGCDFDVVAFTNLSQDHLDYHETLERYFQVKSRLFRCEFGASPKHVINLDDPYGESLIQSSGVDYTFGVAKPADVRAAHIRLTARGTSFRLETADWKLNIELALRGFFNVYNALAAAAIALALNITPDAIKQGLEAVDNIPGRFQVIDVGQPFLVVVDYAHTPDGLEKLISSTREICEGRIWTVFGCGGDRDRSKRPVMGEVAARLSDRIVVTSDNPRSEDPEAIIDQIEAGIRRERANGYLRIADRREAIREAIFAAEPGDAVLIAGKGHETGQTFAAKTIPFDDRQAAREILEERLDDPAHGR